MKKKDDYGRTCLHCKYLSFSKEEPGYSELTPGCPASLSCRKGHFDDKRHGRNYHNALERSDCVDLLKKGNECEDFEDEEP